MRESNSIATEVLVLVPYGPLALLPSDVPRTPSDDFLRKCAQPASGFRSGRPILADFEAAIDVWWERRRCAFRDTPQKSEAAPVDRATPPHDDLRRALRGRCEEAARIKP